MTRNPSSLVPILCALGVLSGCAVGPNAKIPALQKDDGVGAATDALRAVGVRQPDVSAEDEAWWRAFGDQRIDHLVEAGLAANPTIEAARKSYVSAKALAAAEQGAFWPSLGLSLSPSRQTTAKTLASPLQTPKSPYDLDTTEATLSFTPDWAGATRRAVEAARAAADQARASIAAARLAVAYTLTAAALNEAALTEELYAAQRSKDIAEDLLAMTQAERQLGEVSDSDVDAARSAVATAVSAVSVIEKSLRLNRDQMSVWLGRTPGQGFPESLESPFRLADLKGPGRTPRIAPSDLVRRRPDIRQAEANLVQAGAAVGQAVAARLPSLQISAAAGGSALTLGPKLGSDAQFWSVAGALTQPIFAGGALAQRQKAAEAAYAAAKAQYRATVVAAFGNVADAMNTLAGDERVLMEAQRADDLAGKALDRTQSQFSLGDVSRAAVLQAELAALQSHAADIQARAVTLADICALDQALGGGWEPSEPTKANTQ